MSRIIRPITYHYDRSFRSHPALTLALANAICSILGDASAQLISIFNSDPNQKLSFDYLRLFRYFLFGLNMGPISGKWNEFLEWSFPQNAKIKLYSSNNSVKEKSIELLEISTSTSTTTNNNNNSNNNSNVNSYKNSEEDGGITRFENFSNNNNNNHNHNQRPKLLTIFKMVVTDQLVMAPLSIIFFLGFMGFTEGLRYDEILIRINRLFSKLLIANWQVWPIVQLINFRFMPLKLRVPFGAGCGIIWTIFLSYASA